MPDRSSLARTGTLDEAIPASTLDGPSIEHRASNVGRASTIESSRCLRANCSSDNVEHQYSIAMCIK
jgi:hypothetical protein